MPIQPPLVSLSDEFDEAVSKARRNQERERLAQERAEHDQRETYLNRFMQRVPQYKSQGFNPSGYKTPAIENDQIRQEYDPNAPQGGPLKEKPPSNDGDLRASLTVTEDAKPDQEAEFRRMSKAMGVTVVEALEMVAGAGSVAA